MAKKFINRAVQKTLKDKVRAGKVLILLGARRVGKTELIQKYLQTQDQESYVLFNGEDQKTVDLFAERSVNNYRRLLGNKNLLVIDESV